jgi:hypothetical protein
LRAAKERGVEGELKSFTQRDATKGEGQLQFKQAGA